MIMAVVRQALAVARGHRVTPTAEDVASFRAALNHGEGQWGVVTGPVRHWAMLGLDSMITRDPHRALALVHQNNQAAVRELAEYHLSRRSASV